MWGERTNWKGHILIIYHIWYLIIFWSYFHFINTSKMTVWQSYNWPYQTHRVWILFQLCLSAKVARWSVDYTAFLEVLLCRKSDDQWQAPVSACPLDNRQRKQKPFPHCYSMPSHGQSVHFSIFLSFQLRLCLAVWSVFLTSFNHCRTCMCRS